MANVKTALYRYFPLKLDGAVVVSARFAKGWMGRAHRSARRADDLRARRVSEQLPNWSATLLSLSACGPV